LIAIALQESESKSIPYFGEGVTYFNTY